METLQHALRAGLSHWLTRDPFAKHDPQTHAAVTAQVTTADWIATTGPAGDSLHVAFVEHVGETYTLLADGTGTQLLFDSHEWACFTDGATLTCPRHSPEVIFRTVVSSEHFLCRLFGPSATFLS